MDQVKEVLQPSKLDSPARRRADRLLKAALQAIQIIPEYQQQEYAVTLAAIQLQLKSALPIPRV